jgi:hypothetical protein
LWWGEHFVGELCSGANVEFAVDLAEVELDCFGAEEQGGGGFFVACATDDGQRDL